MSKPKFKIDLRGTLMAMNVGDERIIHERDARYANIYRASRRIMETSARKYIVSQAGLIACTRIRRTS